ncbi:MAG: HAD-IA family hydrolase [Oleiphilaceae bacterium]|nr:HAD-IA family hydrolase [Oleiphilaceae bacterium]
MKFDVVVLDWDGTLVDSERYIVNSLSAAAQLEGLPDLGYDRYKEIIGLGLFEALAELYPDISRESVLRLKEAYAQCFVQGEHRALELFAGVQSTLQSLRSQGVRLAVATGKSRRGLERALDTTGLRAYFAATRCADETRSKPHPLMLEELIDELGVRPDRMLMVGDTEYDLAMAAAAGMPSLGVSYGVHEVLRLKKHGPLAIIDRFSEVGDIVLNSTSNWSNRFELASR